MNSSPTTDDRLEEGDARTADDVRLTPRARKSGTARDSWSTYLRDVGKVPLLVAEDEIRLSREFHAARKELVRLARKLAPRGCGTVPGGVRDPGRSRWSLAAVNEYYDSVFAEARRDRRAPARGVRSWIERARDERARMERAREQLINANLRLVVHVAKRYRNHGLPMAELVQEGNIGLMKAVEKYDHHRGHRFSTYAYWWIWQSIVRSLQDRASTIRIPVHVGETLKKVEHVRRRWADEKGREPTLEEISAATGLKENRVKLAIDSPREIRSVEEFGNKDDEDSNLLAFLPDPNAVPPGERLEKTELRQRIARSFRVLDPRERTVLRMRYGFDADREYTLSDIGKRLDLSRERVRQIGRRALRKLLTTRDAAELAQQYYAWSGDAPPPFSAAPASR